MEDFATELLKAGYRLTRWALGYRGRVREWRRTASACGLTNVREVRTLALTHRVEARKGPLRVTFTSSPPSEDDTARGTLIIAGLAHGLSGPAELGRLGGFDVPKGMVEVPPIAGPPLVLAALLDATARRLVSALFEGHVEGEDGVDRSWSCRTRLGERGLEIAYEGDLSDEAVRGALLAARCLVAPEDAAAATAENLRQETHPRLRLSLIHI